MKLRSTLMELAKVIADQAERDPEFAERVGEVLGIRGRRLGERKLNVDVEYGRPKNRRPAAVLDPIAIASQGEAALRVCLSELSLEELRDVVADYGMDPGKLVMKWQSPERVIERIVEMSLARAQKGDAFRSD